MVHTTQSIGGHKKMTEDPNYIICKDKKGRAYIKIIEEKKEPEMKTKSFTSSKKKPATKSKKFNSLYQRKED